MFIAFVTFQFTAATELGIHINIANQQGFTPLHTAALNGHYDLTQLFLKRGAEVNARNFTHKSTPLHLASKQDKMNVSPEFHEFDTTFMHVYGLFSAYS